MEKDKRFLLFWAPEYYPGGGMNDKIGSYDTLDETIEAAKKDGRAHLFEYDIYDRIEGYSIAIGNLKLST